MVPYFIKGGDREGELKTSLSRFHLPVSLNFGLCVHRGRGVFGSEQNHCGQRRGLKETESICDSSLHRGA